MSELAFNVNGEPFEVLPNMAAWRVRKLKPKGAPEVVYGRDGLPLFLPLDADIEDLRREARGDGRYRLDPVDDHNRALSNAQAAYVCVHPIEREPEPKPPTVPLTTIQAADTTAQLVSALLESQRQHTEMAKMYVSQFPAIVTALSGVVKSAGDAGLTARVPLVLPAVPEIKTNEPTQVDDDSDDDDDDEIDEQIVEEIESDHAAVAVAQQPEYSWARVAQTLADQVSPHVGPLLAGLPGLAAMLGAKRAPAASDAARGPDHGDPAPAEAEPRVSSAPAAGFDAGMLVRINAIKAQLTPVERQFAQTLLDEIPAEELPTWFERLRAMSVDEAADYVRQMFREGQAAAASAQPAEPATATMPSAAPRSAPPPASVPATAPSATRRDGRRSAVTAHDPAAATTAKRSTRRTAPSNGLAMIDEATQAHLAAIDAALTLDEAGAMRKQFAALSPRDRASWVATLVMLPVADAVAAIRAQLAAADTAVPAQAPEDASMSDAPQRAGATEAAPIAETTTAPTVPEPVAAERDADRHLAEVESALTAEERVRMHTMFSKASPDEREAWLDRLLSVPPLQGTAMLREALGATTSQPRLAEPHSDSAPTTAATASAGGHAPATENLGAEPEPYEPTLDEIELENETALDDAEHLDQAEHLDDAEPNDAELGDVQRLDNAAPTDGESVRETAGEAPQVAGDAQAAVAQPSALIATRTAQPTSETDAAKHFQTIEAALTLAEKMRAHEVAAQRPVAELRRWYADLLRLSVPDAVAKIRAELAQCDGDLTVTKKGDVS